MDFIYLTLFNILMILMTNSSFYIFLVVLQAWQKHSFSLSRTTARTAQIEGLENTKFTISFNNYPSYLIAISLGKHFPATSKLMSFLLHFVRFIINQTSAFVQIHIPKSYPLKDKFSVYSALHMGDKDSSVVRTLLALFISLHFCWLNSLYLQEIHLFSLCLSFSSVGFFEEWLIQPTAENGP